MTTQNPDQGQGQYQDRGAPGNWDNPQYEYQMPRGQQPQRYKSVTLAVPANGQPGDSALFFEDANGNGTTIVNLRPGDLPLARAALTPADPALAAIQDMASIALGPGARRYVQQGHVAGYALGVRDMEAAREDVATEAEQVADYLGGLYERVADGRIITADPGIEQAISRVRDLIIRRSTAYPG